MDAAAPDRKEYPVTLRIVLANPPAGLWFWLEDNRGNKFSMTQSVGEEIAFEFDVIVKVNKKTGKPNFAGPFARGTSVERFFYVYIGKLAGEMGARLKLWIGKDAELTWKVVKEVASDPKKVFMARYWRSEWDHNIATKSGPKREVYEWVVAERL